MSLEWFVERIGKTILRNQKEVPILNEKWAEHLFATQAGYEFKDLSKE